MDAAVIKQKTEKVKTTIGLHWIFCLPRKKCWGVVKA